MGVVLALSAMPSHMLQAHKDSTVAALTTAETYAATALAHELKKERAVHGDALRAQQQQHAQALAAAEADAARAVAAAVEEAHAVHAEAVRAKKAEWERALAEHRQKLTAAQRRQEELREEHEQALLRQEEAAEAKLQQHLRKVKEQHAAAARELRAKHAEVVAAHAAGLSKEQQGSSLTSIRLVATFCSGVIMGTAAWNINHSLPVLSRRRMTIIGSIYAAILILHELPRRCRTPEEVTDPQQGE